MKSEKEEEKYKIERHFFKRFSDLYFGNSITETSKSEAPDFLIEMDGEKVGIEVMQLFKEKGKNEKYPLIEKYSLENLIIETAQQLFNSRNNIPLNIRFEFVDKFSLPKDKVLTPAKKICEIIEEQIQKKPLNTQFKFSIEENLPEELSEISGYFLPEIDESIWYSAHAMFLPTLSQEQIKVAIEKKDKKAPKYLEQASQLILLLVEGMPPYSWFDKIEKVDSKNFNSRFDKIFIIRNLSNELIEIK